MNIQTLRASEFWQKAGGVYVRIQGMAKQHGITLDEEFDETDANPDTKYIVLLDDDFPIATCRMYALSDTEVGVGRVVVLPEYRGKELGRKVIEEAEAWAMDLGYKKVILDARDVAVGFYEKLGYTADYSKTSEGTFSCIYMEKVL